MSANKQGQPKAGYVYAVAAVALAIILAGVATNSAAPPAPSVAELSPQAAAAPLAQNSSNEASYSLPGGGGSASLGGGGAGGAGGFEVNGGRTGDSGPGSNQKPPLTPASAADGTSASAAPAGSSGAPMAGQGSDPAPPFGQPPATSHRCVGSPPRQIEDPQSPPCVDGYVPVAGDGHDRSTSAGVTSSEVKIVWACTGGTSEAPFDCGTQPNSLPSMLEKFFNERFEFYTRRLRLVPPGSKMSFGSDESAAKNLAFAKTVEALDPFASTALALDQQDAAFPEHAAYYDELARAKTISASTARDMPLAPPADPEARKYEWSYLPDFGIMSRHVGEFICKQLAHAPASHAGGKELLAPERVFGYWITPFRLGSVPDTSALDTALNSCNVKVNQDNRVVFRDNNFGEDPASNQAAANQLSKLQNNGVTSIICVCENQVRLTGMPEAGSYSPEWIFSSLGYHEDEQYNRTSASDPQLAHSIGVSLHSQTVPTADLPVTAALKSVNPNFTWQPSSAGGPKCCLFEDAGAHIANEAYESLLLLASGIQMAGPDLTADSFEYGLQHAQFPNPNTPNGPAGVGFGTGHAMNNDAGAMWWDPAKRTTWGPGLVGGMGAWCWADQGRRYRLNEWPGRETPVGLFTGVCKE